MTPGAPEGSKAFPLSGCRVVVTRARAQAGGLEALLTDLGATVISLPAIVIADPPSFEDLDAALGELEAGAYEWVAFLSANAVTYVTKRLRVLSLDVRAISNSHVVAVGKATARALGDHGISADTVPETFRASALAESLGRGPGRVLVPRALEAPADALDPLRSKGWRVDEVVAYSTVLAPEGPGIEILRKHEFDIVTLTSGSTARGLSSLISPAEAGLTPTDPGTQSVVCIGPEAASVATELGFRVDAIASEHSAEGLVEAVARLRDGFDRRFGG